MLLFGAVVAYLAAPTPPTIIPYSFSLRTHPAVLEEGGRHDLSHSVEFLPPSSRTPFLAAAINPLPHAPQSALAFVLHLLVTLSLLALLRRPVQRKAEAPFSDWTVEPMEKGR